MSEPGTVSIVVGLGNPGLKYDGTRHNVGFEVLDRLWQQAGSPKWNEKFHGQFAKVIIGGADCVLLRPLTYMNESGRSVAAAVQFFKTPLSSLLIVCDDLALPLGKLRLRSSGSSGGQKGLNDILRRVGSQDIARLRIGIDPTPEHWETADYVLSKFSPEDRRFLEPKLDVAVEAARCWLNSGIDTAMNQYNR
jgi:peptidyl-tRNA hydrolase, PTH1 family